MDKIAPCLGTNDLQEFAYFENRLHSRIRPRPSDLQYSSNIAIGAYSESVVRCGGKVERRIIFTERFVSVFGPVTCGR